MIEKIFVVIIGLIIATLFLVVLPVLSGYGIWTILDPNNDFWQKAITLLFSLAASFITFVVVVVFAKASLETLTNKHK